LLTDRQNKHSDSYQQGNQSTNSERESPVPTIHGLRSSALLRCSNAKPEEKVAHRRYSQIGLGPANDMNAQQQKEHCDQDQYQYD
jgi:hypothetical protein